MLLKKVEVDQLKIGSLLSYFQMGLGIIISLVYTPVMIRLLGKNEYGLYNTVSSTISMLSILSLGFNSSYIRYYAKLKSKKDETAIAKLNGLFFIIFMIIGCIAFACGTFLCYNLELVFDKGLTTAEYVLAKKLMFLLTINLSISFPMSVFQNIISAHERYVFLKLLGMLNTVLGPMVSIPLLLMGYRSAALVSVTLGIAVVTNVFYFLYARKILQVQFVFRGLDGELFKSLLVFTSFVALNMVVDQVNNNMGKFILGRYRGTEAVAVYSVGFTLYYYYVQFSTAISGVFTPRIHRIVNETKENKMARSRELTDLFVKVGRIQFIILALIASGLVFWGKEFIGFWAGAGYTDAYYVTILLVLSASIALIQNLGIEIQRAINKHKFRSIVYLFMAIVNLILTIHLCRSWGAVGTAVGTAVSFVFANGLIMNIYYHKKCNVDILVFWKSILRLSAGLIIPIILGIVMKTFFEFKTIFSMLLGIGVYSMVYFISMWIFGMNDFEKNGVLKHDLYRK